MEENYTPYNEDVPAGLTLSAADLGYLREIKKWAKFLGIVGFVLTGLMVLLGFGMGTIMGSFSNEDIPIPGYVFGILYVLIALLYFFPSLFLYRYSTHLSAALARRDNQELTKAFSNEKSFFKFWAILMIVILIIYGLGFIGIMMMAMFKS